MGNKVKTDAVAADDYLWLQAVHLVALRKGT